MLDAFIIEQIRRREEQESNRVEHSNRLQLPVPFAYEDPNLGSKRRPGEDATEPPNESGRGVIVVDF